MSITEGARRALSATVSPPEANQLVTWIVLDDQILEYDVNTGEVVAKRAGTTTVIGETVNSIRAECKITVNPKAPVFVKDLPATASVKAGETFTATVEIDRDDCDWELTKAGVVIDDTKSGGKTYTMTLANVSKASAGEYYIKVKVKGYPNVVARSTHLTLTVTD